MAGDGESKELYEDQPGHVEVTMQSAPPPERYPGGGVKVPGIDGPTEQPGNEATESQESTPRDEHGRFVSEDDDDK